MRRNTALLAILLLAALATVRCADNASAKPAAPAQPTNAQLVERGKLLVTIGGCNDCHTPLKIGPNGPEPDMTLMLAGHPSTLVMPPPPKTEGPWMWTGAATNTAFAGPWGISYAPNLTPDQVSGLGIWSEEMFIKTMRTGRHMGVSRPILPPMPWQNMSRLPDVELKAIFAYLRSIEPIRNEVPDPVIAPPPAS